MSRANFRAERIDWYDSFDRADGPMGRDWIDGHDVAPTMFDPLGIHDGAVVVTDPHARGPPENYEPEVHPSLNTHPPADGKLYPGIGWVARPCPPGWLPDIEMTWAGWWDTSVGAHAEATPLLWVDPDNPLGGFGCWPSAFTADGGSPATGVGFVGFMGAPPELFNEDEAPVIGTFGFSVTNRVPIRIRTRDTGTHVETSFDGVVKSSIAVTHPLIASLRGNSDLHGIELDTHFCRPRSAIPSMPGALNIRFRGIG